MHRPRHGLSQTIETDPVAKRPSRTKAGHRGNNDVVLYGTKRLIIKTHLLPCCWRQIGDNHIRFTVVSDMLPKRVRHWFFVAADAVGVATGIALAYAGHVFALRRGDVASSGLKSTADALAQSTGIEALTWLGKVGPYQYAIAFGGALLAIAAALKLMQRLSGRAEEV